MGSRQREAWQGRGGGGGGGGAALTEGCPPCVKPRFPRPEFQGEAFPLYLVLCSRGATSPGLLERGLQRQCVYVRAWALRKPDQTPRSRHPDHP